MFSGSLASLLAVLVAAPPERSAASSALGSWTANGATLELVEEEGKIVGRLTGEGGPCPLPAGAEVLRGTLLEDSLSAQARLCLVAPACGADPGTALAILLVTRALSGGVHTRAPCAHDVHTLVLRRPGRGDAQPPVPAGEARLSPEPPPQPNTRIASSALLPTPPVPAAVGRIPGHPVGEPAHPSGYDPRDARNASPERGEESRLLTEGAAYLAQGRFEKARKLFRAVVLRDPHRAEAYNGVGVTFYARGDLDEALAWYKRALEADPRFGDAYYNLACVYALQGHHALAFRYLRLAALNHYSERAQLESDPDLESLRQEPQWAEILEQVRAEAKPSGAPPP